jgi:hypothetical protein
MLGSMNLTRSCLSERRNRVLNILFRDSLLAGDQVPLVEDLLKVPPNKPFIGL